METFYWYDFETFGANPSKDKPSQFAGIRTDKDFNIIDEPLNIYCKPSDDFIPHPQACLVTGITPQLALEKGVSEKTFFREIHLQVSQANTCTLGYNSVRFDDEVLRHGLYRNFYDAYAREWQNGNSRWDIIDLLRMTHALRPEGINWPENEDGKVSFRLELLSKANGIEHEDAHDALADVYATINMAKLVRQKQPKLFEYLLSLKDKRLVMAEIDLVKHKPFVHSSGMFGNAHQYTGIMMPLVTHPTNKNSVICVDLSQLNTSLESLSSEQMKERIFTRQDELPEGIDRLPIKEIHINKCPAVAPLGVMNDACQQRLNIDLAQCLEKAKAISLIINQVKDNLLQVYKEREYEPITNPDHALYSGGFIGQTDKNQMDQIRIASWDDLKTSHFEFKDNRLEELLFRYRARNAPESLDKGETKRWKAFRKQSLFEKSTGSSLIYSEYTDVMEQLRNDESANQEILNQLDAYVGKITTSAMIDGL